MSEPTIGVIGTGHFAAYFIAALRKGGFEGKVLLSPHNTVKANALASEHGCTVAETNEHLIVSADWVLLAIRPGQVDETFRTTSIPSGKQVISAVAGMTVAELEGKLGGATDIVRIIPASYIEIVADGIIPMFPDSPVVRSVLAKAGTVVAFDDEGQFDLSMAGSCLSGWMYRFMDSLQDWFVERGYSPEQARLVVADNIMGAAAYAKHNPGRNLGDISDGIATEGTYTKAGLDHLLKEQASLPWRGALDILERKLKQSSD